MKAYLKNYRQSPRKVRLIADLIRGKKVEEALTTLKFTPKRASGAISKLVSSAAANAEHNFKTDKGNLVIQDIAVDEGITLKRWRPRARGRAGRILKRTSNVSIKLTPVDVAKKKAAPKAKAKKETQDKKSVRSNPKKTTVKKETKPKTARKPVTKKPQTGKAKAKASSQAKPKNKKK